MFFFFFKQKTAYEMRISDWSSDVCSSDLLAGYEGALDRLAVEGEAAALRAALRRNVFGTLPEAEGDLAGLVAYVLAQAAALDAQPGEALRLGDRKSVV